MKLSRKSLQKSQEQLDKGAAEFVDSAEELSSPPNPVGRPKANRELTKPVSISLTDTDKKLLDRQFKRFNMVAYQKDGETTTSLTRSDLVKLMAKLLDEKSDDELYSMINTLIA
ncbi:hypothetical protein [Vibrio marisflavi]|uniref:Uncharacterized protein n=1 Tax=Vibrio marisflavi CECT 7928 TaxID=634439 RepID=A0ABM9A9A0_9VIBR|nr:hypothetical protein [Vibrio marisflavi]CAH0543122.1 hypothetical protein VMF7928_04411 [Vibrio marisflavi CECT 7928]